ncbi:methyltransferase type 11 [Polaribacter sejongensis]|uniref:Methyltransferase type 11 n=1 Tax=Polaribacter sejongensis TaxID=985043 RepID=A0ABN5F8Y9_9FLAO|nr:methyltransferase [Polaribacter sejongensis]AUC22989.1 methyltransferase type 11 [Polaribacter sejongensis]
MSSALKINKPTPIHPGDDLIKFDSNTDVRETLYAMREGQSVLITEFYSNGMLLLKELQKHLKIRLPNKTIKEQHAFRAEYHKLSNQILLQIKNQKLVVDKAPKIGWFAKLFANKNNFLLTFPEVQRLNSAWQKYNKGIKVPVLRNKVHPYLGTYFPTRFDHLTLFDNWLKRYEGPKKSAIDVGIGSGVLSFQMVQHGFQKVFGTDTNPNAIFGLKEFMGETKLSRKVELDYGNLFGKWEKETELIVFNPPWLPAISSEENIDEAVYYNKNLFSKFFAEANNRLAEDGKLVILFSNAAQIKKLTKENPIEKELAKGIRFKLEKCLKKTIKPTVDKTKRNKKEAALEEVQLWVLTKV